jgi:dolichyl-diphosphooligosaccharide--protein glycosyltransferase
MEGWLKVGEGIKDRLSKTMEPFSKLRFQVSHGSIIAFSALALILFVAFAIRILPLRWENLSGGTALLNEFDPYYQFSLTQYMVNHGILSPYWPTQWINNQLWYPFGYNMGSSSLPSTPMTGAVLYDISKALGANIDLMTFVSLIPPFIGVLSCLVMYFIGKDYGGRAVGLFAALFLALEPSIVQRTSLGFFDTQVVGTLGLVLFIFLFLRSIDSNRSLRASILYSLSAGAALAYFIGGWGGAYYVIGLTVLFAFIMVLLRRYSQRLLLSYSLTFGLGLFIATKIPYISLSYLVSYAVLPAAAVFIILLLAEVLRHNISTRSKILLSAASLLAIAGGFLGLWATGHLGSIAGKFGSVLNPFIRITAPIINSVAEHQISAWGNIYIELGIGILFFLVGLYFAIRNPTNRNVFLLVFAVTSLYFAGSMVRLLAIFAPAFAVITAVGILGTIKPFYTLLQEAPRNLAKTKRRVTRVSKEYSGVAIFLIFLILVTDFAFSPQTAGIPRTIDQAFVPTAISASSLPIGGSSLAQPVAAWREALSWISNNVPSNNVVVSWWDYGFWLTYLGNVTTLCDNTTGNTTQIENVGLIYMGNENQSLQMLSTYNDHNSPGRVNYILVFTVLQMSPTSSGSSSYVAYPYGFGDEGKWVWMARISGAAKDRLLKGGYMSPSTAWTDETQFGNSSSTGRWQWNLQGDNSTIYELMNYAEVQYCNEATAALSGQGYSFTPDAKTTQPTYFSQAYIAGSNVSPFQYGGLVPLVAIYKINYNAYYNATGTTGSG